jgi:hypothetical protein
LKQTKTVHLAHADFDLTTASVSIHENASFWTSSYILPSDGSGPKGSVSEMLAILGNSEGAVEQGDVP